MDIYGKWGDAILALALVLGSYELLQKHDALLKAESMWSAQQQVITAAQKSIDQAKADQARKEGYAIGERNTANGYAALQNNTTGIDNMAIGFDALENGTQEVKIPPRTPAFRHWAGSNVIH